MLIEDITDYVHKDTRQDGDFNIILCELEKVKKKKTNHNGTGQSLLSSPAVFCMRFILF